MTSEKQARANRKNALESTGPKTPEGKAAVRLNALKHGLLSRETLLPGEDEEALTELSDLLREELQPVGELQNLLVDRIISAYWRLSRLGRVEAGIFAWELYGQWANRARVEASSYTKQVGGLKDLDPDPFQPTTKITDQEKHQEAISKAREMECEARSGNRHVGENLHPRRGRRERFFQALALRDCHRAQPLQGTARTPTPASRPPS